MNGKDIKDTFPILRDLSSLDFKDSDSSSIIYQALMSDPNFEVNSREEMFHLRNKKAFRKISPRVYYRLTGLKEIQTYMGYGVRESEEIETFWLISDVRVCPNPVDTLLEPHRDFAIAYGTFLNFVCYSPEELTESFIITDTFTAFRRPDRPDEVFPPGDEFLNAIDQLLETLQTQDPESLPHYTERVQPLIDKIEQGLSDEQEIQVESMELIFENMEETDRLLAERIFKDFFEAGMTQRTWNGSGTPYPMKYEQTRELDLEEIENRMTPILNDIREQAEKLSPEAKIILGRLPIVDYDEGVFFRRVDPLLNFEKMTREGEFCIGYGSRLMIYSGYFYLMAIGTIIDNFNIEEFDPQSTHR